MQNTILCFDISYSVLVLCCHNASKLPFPLDLLNRYMICNIDVHLKPIGLLEVEFNI